MCLGQYPHTNDHEYQSESRVATPAAVWNVSYFVKEQRVKPVNHRAAVPTQGWRDGNSSLITALYHSHTHTHTHTHTQIRLYLKLLYQHCDKSHKAALLQHFCIITSIWVARSKSGRKKAINSLTVCVTHTHTHTHTPSYFFLTRLSAEVCVCVCVCVCLFFLFWVSKVLEQVDALIKY